MFTCRIPTVGKNIASLKYWWLGGQPTALWLMTLHNNPQYWCGASGGTSGGHQLGHHWGDGLVFKAMVACQIHQTLIYGQCVSFLLDMPNFHVCMMICSLFV